MKIVFSSVLLIDMLVDLIHENGATKIKWQKTYWKSANSEELSFLDFPHHSPLLSSF